MLGISKIEHFISRNMQCKGNQALHLDAVAGSNCTPRVLPDGDFPLPSSPEGSTLFLAFPDNTVLLFSMINITSMPFPTYTGF